MAKVKLVPFITEISGTMGDFVFRKSKKEGEAILAKRPPKSRYPRFIVILIHMFL